MKKTALLLSISLLVLGGYACDSQPAAKTQAPAAKIAPDNTERNVRDRSGETLTPGDQSESEADRTLTQRVRQAVMADDSLSTNAAACRPSSLICQRQPQCCKGSTCRGIVCMMNAMHS